MGIGTAHPVTALLSIYSESQASAHYAASHGNVHYLLLHPILDNAQGMVLENPRKVYHFFLKLAEI
jgi:hypothetical protein